ncbi:N-alpha-acetyltransferase 15 NatA auxiliary subunit [Taenia crassiceps]|uniref:N-alpha-acetyltransferase 15 NatA auxiliary subunit n=1 Tax=Taenia crassiceps TaxID=6207 RepID=A0ABR4QSB2_9CEST
MAAYFDMTYMEKNFGAAPLPPKELSLFKRIVYYDQKQYKTGLKFANQILSNPKFADHGGWHIYGLIMKSDRKYDEAIRCYIQALKLDKNNLQVLRDLSVLQMHTRDLDGCLKTRNKLLTQRPNQKASWVGYAIVQHLRGNLDTAATVIYEFLKVQTAVEPYNYEHSELLMYYIYILKESSKFEEALDFMDLHAKEIVDSVSYLETYGNYSLISDSFIAGLLLQLGRVDDAENIVWQLLERNPDCKSYYELFYKVNEARSKRAMKLSDKRQVLRECVEKFSSARLPKLLFLETLDGIASVRDLFCGLGDEFRFHVDVFMRKYLRKGVPNLFVQLRRFYNSDERRTTLEKLYLTYRANLDDHETLGPVSYGQLKSQHLADDAIEPPSTSLWLNYLIAQHYNYMRQTQKALNVVSKEIEINPTIVDLYVLKAEIYRDAGDIITASRWMDEAQSLDTADRFINAQCTKYMVQAHRIEDAEAMASKFTRGSTTATQYLIEMQCMWFLIENARSYKAMHKYGEALKFCHEIDRAYTAVLEDQLDFHSYCLRKGTLRSYVETIRLEDRLRDHPAYFDAACLAIEIYLYLHVNPLGSEQDEENKQNANLSSSEMKKLRNKQRRAERRAEAIKEDEKKKEHQNLQRNKERNEDPENRPPEVEQLSPQKLARPENALDEAARFLQPLIDLSGNRIETHCLAYEVFERKGKYLLMLRSIRRGIKLPGARDHPCFNECLCRFLIRMSELKPEPGNLVHEILLQEVHAIFGGNELPRAAETNDDFIRRNSMSFLHVFRGTLTKAIIDPNSSKESLKQLPSPTNKGFGTVSWQVLFDALEVLRTYSNLKLAPITNEIIDDFRCKCSALYPLATVFFTEAALESHLNATLYKNSAPTSNEASSKRSPCQSIDEVKVVVKALDTFSCNESTGVNGDAENKLNGHLIANKKATRQKRKKGCNVESAKPNAAEATSSDFELSNDGNAHFNEVVSRSTPQALSASDHRVTNSQPHCLRFSMDFMYPKGSTYEGKSGEIFQLNGEVPPPYSLAFDDNFDGINLTQMLEKTAVDAASDEALRNSSRSCSKECSFTSASEQCDPLSKNVLCGGAVPKSSRGFETESGDVLGALSRESLSRARRLINENVNQLEERSFIRDDPMFHDDGSPQVPKQNDPTLNIVLNKDASFNLNCGLKTAVDAFPKAPCESLSQTKRLVEECRGQVEDSNTNKVLHGDAFPSEVTTSSSNTPKQCGRSSSIILPEAGYCNFRQGFKTASGTALKMPSCESLSRAKRIFEECVDLIADSGNSPGSSKAPRQGTLRSHDKPCVSSLCDLDPADSDRPLKSHPETAKSDSIKFMEESSKRGSHGENDDHDESFPSEDVSKSYFSFDSLNLTGDTFKGFRAGHNLHGKAENDNSSRSGFMTGHGVPLILPSDESVKRARRLLEDCFKDHDENKPIDDGMRSDFPTRSNGACRHFGPLVELSEKGESERLTLNTNEVGCASVVGGSSVTQGTPFIISNHAASLGRFVSSAGMLPTPLSDESPRQVTTTCVKRVIDFEGKSDPSKIESQSLGGSESPKFVSATTEIDVVMSPTLDFDGSFEISSQMMNVIEGTSSQYSDNVGLSEVESQRVEARLVQQAEADLLFKPSVTSRLNCKPYPSESLSASTTHKIVQEPMTPGTLWRLRRRSGCIVHKSLPSFRAPYPFEKNLYFVGDFLRLDDASSLSINSASNLRFKLDLGSVNISYRLGDNVEIIPDSFGYAGCVEVVRAFVCSPGVNKGLVSRRWITHHYSQIAWRFGCVALVHYKNLVDEVFPHLSFPDSTIQRTDGRLLLHALLLELKYRYDRELEAVERSPVRKIVERDDTPAKRLVLCVSHLESLPDHQYQGRLTDGWYHVDWIPDSLLARVIKRGQIKVGTKLVTAGAELVQTPSGFGGSRKNSNDGCDDQGKDEDTHLFGSTSNGLSLRLNGNSTRLAPPNARLGFATHSPIAHLPPIPLSTISPDGGLVSCICVLVQRRFQLQYMETCSSHVASNEDGRAPRYHVFRDPRSEEAAERLHAENCRLAFDQAVNEFNSSRGFRGRRIQPQASFLASLGLDGEALWNAVSNALDPSLAESDLSAAQLDAMFRYKETVMQEILAQSSSKREVTQLLRLQVAGIHPLDVEKHMELPLTLWNPTEEMLDILREGSVVQLTRLQVSTTRSTDPFAPFSSCASNAGQVLSLSGGRGTTVRQLKVAEVIKFSKRGQPTTSASVQDRINMVYRPRSFLSVGSLKTLFAASSDFPRVVDFTALVVGTKTISALNSSGLHHTVERSELSVVYLASTRNEDGEEDFSTLAVLRIWGGLERYSLTSVLAARNRVRFTDVQMRDCGKLLVHSDFPPGGSSEVFYVLLNYSTASYVTSEKLPRESTIRRFQTPWKETPQFYSYMETCMESHFKRFFSGKSVSSLATPNSLISAPGASASTFILQQTSKLESISVSTPCSLSNFLKGRRSLSPSPSKLETPNKINKSPSMFSALKTRTRTGLYRPRRALPIVTMTPVSTSSSARNVLSSPSHLQSKALHEFMPSSCSPPERSLRPSCSTPLPAKRSCSLIGNFEAHSDLLKTPTISSSSSKLSRSPLFSTFSPKQESVLSQPKSPKSPQFNSPMSPSCLSSDSVEPDSLISVGSKLRNLNKSPPLRSHLESSSIPQPDTLNPSLSVARITAQLNVTSEDSPSLDVTIADLVKTRKRGRNSIFLCTSVVPKKRSLNLKSTP